MQLEGATPAEIAFLTSARVGHLATVDTRGRPHALPVCFALVDGTIFTPLDEKPKRVPDDRLQRVRDILANPSVCLVVDRYSENWDELAWLQVRAEAELLPIESSGREPIIQALRDRYPQYQRMALERRPLLKLVPRRIVSWRVNR
jgi:PPOX class probable F420-dependent enzyme